MIFKLFHYNGLRYISITYLPACIIAQT